VAELNRLFANGEVDFAMSYGPAFASVRMERGEFPATVRTFVFERGTLGNHSSLAIPFNAANAAGAMVTANELLGFETGLGMARALGTLPPHRMDALTEAQRAAVRALPRGAATLPAEELARHFLAEPDAEYLNRWDKDWNAMVLRQ
jgi:putative spermidine/putrescine transport system substrate-binding protein